MELDDEQARSEGNRQDLAEHKIRDHRFDAELLLLSYVGLAMFL